ncbi:MAG: hypothetical protein AAF742_00710, partial [Pseudomonadota bacterium]
ILNGIGIPAGPFEAPDRFDITPRPGTAGDDFMSNLEMVMGVADLDADVMLASSGETAFESLTSVYVSAGASQGSGDAYRDIVTESEENPFLWFVGGEREDLAFSDVMLTGNKTGETFGALENVTVMSQGTDDGGLAHDGFGSINVHLTDISSEEFDVTLSTTENGAISFVSVDNPGLMTVTATGENLVDLAITGDNTGLELIDLRGLTETSEFTVFYSNDIEISDGLETWLGAGTGQYRAVDGIQEIIAFTSDGIFDVRLTNFDAGAGGDLIDFSFLGVEDEEDLILTDVFGSVQITTAGQDFEGVIEVVGVSPFDVSDNLIFAG